MSERDHSQRVVITGMGIAAPTPNGMTVEGFWNDLVTNNHGIRDMSDILAGYTDSIKTRIGAPLAPFDLSQKLAEAGFDVKSPNIKKDQLRWHRSAQAVVWSGSMALREAQLLKDGSFKVDPRQIDPDRFGTYQGTGVGGTLRMVDIQRILDGFGEKNRVTPNDMMHLLPGRVDEVPAMLFNSRAFSDTQGTECAAGLSAIDRAMDDLRLGRADIVLAGGVETAAHPVTIAAFEVLRALNPSDDPDSDPKPFSLNPGGLVLGEGAGQVVLETLEHAFWRRQKLGAAVNILAEVLGTGKSADAYHDTFPSEDGAGRAIDAALIDAGLTDTEQIESIYVNAHATATDGDVLEFRSIASRFSPGQVKGISTIKSHTGHTFGAAGALGTVTGVKVLHTGLMPANRNLNEPLPETEGWEMLPNHPKRDAVKFVMVNAFGFGGKNRVAILSKVEV